MVLKSWLGIAAAILLASGPAASEPLSRAGIDAREVRRNGRQGLAQHLGRHGAVEPEAFGVAHGADVDAQDSRGRTALMEACAHGRLVATRLLLEHGASVELQDAEGSTALRLADLAGTADGAAAAALVRANAWRRLRE